MARLADRHDLYERSVQDCASEVKFVSRTFKKVRGRKALTLREDFGGTGGFCREWLRTDKERRAWSVDLDRPTQVWGEDRHFGSAPPRVRERMTYLNANVLDGVGPQTDIAVAFNFSYWIFETRAQLRRYFEAVRERLADDGMLFLDLFGGTEGAQADVNRNDLGEFVYVWEQRDFDVLTHHMDCAIHFEFPDGSAMRDAFTYSWRMWTIPELRELLEEAGFSKVHVYWEKTDDDGDGTGRFFEPKQVDNDPVWWTYIGAER